MKIFFRHVIHLLMLLILCVWFWWPALLSGKTIFHGDSIVHGLPLMNLHAAALRGDESILWSDKVYGGHPIYAESQGAFFQPLNILLAWLVPPVYGHNLFHFLCMLISGVGTYGLCRSLGMRGVPASFGAIAVVFASLWESSQQNLSIAGALCWVPATFWAVESWFKKPTFPRAALLAVVAVFIFFAGYPQALHGAAIYIAASLIPTFFSSDGKFLWRVHGRQLFMTALAGLLVAVGLAAVQWLPLLELTTMSGRSSGIGLFLPILNPEPYYRGLLFAPAGIDLPSGQYCPSMGSLLVPMLASLVLLVSSPSRIKGHAVAALFLFQLGMGPASPLFNVIYDHNLIPGIHFFRIMSLYLAIAIVGIAVVSAWCVDRIGYGISISKARLWGALVSLALFWGAALVWLHVPSMRYTSFLWAFLAISVIVLLSRVDKKKYIPLLLLVLLCGEFACLRMRPFAFVDVRALEEPSSRTEQIHAKNINDYKFLDVSLAVVYAMKNPLAGDLPQDLRRLLAAVSPMTNTMWGVASINGTMGLQTQRRTLSGSIIESEIRNQSQLMPGQRLIDVLGVRFISADDPLVAPGLHVVESDEPHHLSIMENAFALPRFQTYKDIVVVRSLDEAVQYFGSRRESGLVIEDPEYTLKNDGRIGGRTGNIEIVGVDVAKPTQYVVRVVSDVEGWVFLADANYPGWSALLDGRDVKVFSANILGKAVRVPIGEHKIEIFFKPISFYIGFCVTVATLIILIFWGMKELTYRFKEIKAIGFDHA